MLCDCDGISCTWRLVRQFPPYPYGDYWWELVRTGGSSNGGRPCLAKNFCYCDTPPEVTENMSAGHISVSSCYYGGPEAACPPCVAP
jgi:hypothetical protein